MQYVFFNISPNFIYDLFAFVAKYYLPLFIMFCLFALSIYFLIKIFFNILKYKKYKKAIFDLQNQIKTEAKSALLNLEGKELIKKFINYLENIKLQNKYQSIDEVFLLMSMDQDEIDNIKNIIYKNSGDINKACDTIKQILSKN